MRLRDLAAMAGVPDPASAFVASLEQGPFAQATLTGDQATDPDALLALQVNGADLSLDHASRPGSSCPRCPVCTARNGFRSIEFRRA